MCPDGGPVGAGECGFVSRWFDSRRVHFGSSFSVSYFYALASKMRQVSENGIGGEMHNALPESQHPLFTSRICTRDTEPVHFSSVRLENHAWAISEEVYGHGTSGNG